MTDKKIIDWPQYFELCNLIVDQIKTSGIIFTDIIGLARGGLIPAQYIAYKLGIRRVHSFGISTYSEKDERLPDNEILIYQRVTAPFNKECKVLVIDDIADSGRSLIRCINFHYDFFHSDGYKTCTLHYKPSSKFKPDFYATEIKDSDWIVYPYDN